MTSTHAKGFRKPDAKWKKMKALYDACIDADIALPEEVNSYFNYEEPDNTGVIVELRGTTCCKEYSADSCSGYEIDVTKLPKDITIIRVYNSY